MAAGQVESSAFRSLSYGLFVLTAREGEKDNGCIINTMAQITTSPNRISICVNKGGLTHDMVLRTGVFNVSVLTESTPFDLFQHFGFQSGRDTDKFASPETGERSANGLMYLPRYTNAFFSGKVISATDYGTHTLFIAEVTEARSLSKEPSATYAYYHAHIKPRPSPPRRRKKASCAPSAAMCTRETCCPPTSSAPCASIPPRISSRWNKRGPDVIFGSINFLFPARSVETFSPSAASIEQKDNQSENALPPDHSQAKARRLL